MKGTIWLVVVLLFVFFPWIIGVTDILSWALFGAQMTNIPWETDRGVVLAVWPILCGLVVSGLAAITSV
jgi:hypothetical protein